MQFPREKNRAILYLKVLHVEHIFQYFLFTSSIIDTLDVSRSSGEPREILPPDVGPGLRDPTSPHPAALWGNEGPLM